MQVLAYIDAAYGVRDDWKSQTGGFISLGRGPVFAKSAKQKLVTKSSSEAELVGISDMLSEVIWTRDFLIEQGYQVDASKVYQDNTSAIHLANRGRALSERTRHIAIRFFFVKDRIDNGEVEIEHLGTADMIADLLTKPLQGDLFRRLRSLLLNME
jgi:hypothetical protein